MQLTMHSFLHRNRDNGHGQGLLVLVYAYMHSLFNELAWRLRTITWYNFGLHGYNVPQI